jgi:hypothetical protein
MQTQDTISGHLTQSAVGMFSDEVENRRMTLKIATTIYISLFLCAVVPAEENPTISVRSKRGL